MTFILGMGIYSCEEGWRTFSRTVPMMTCPFVWLFPKSIQYMGAEWSLKFSLRTFFRNFQSVRRERILSVQVMMIFAVLSSEKFLVGKHCGSAVHAYPKKRLMRVTSYTALFSPSSVSLKSWRPILAWLTVSGSNTVTCSPGWPNA